jgi:four helix bundle protein
MANSEQRKSKRMFDFEKLDVYQVVKDQNLKVLNILKVNKNIDPYLMDQWKRASLNILLNLAEGTGRMTDQDKKHYLTIARSSVYESVAILDLLKSMKVLDDATFTELYDGYEKSSKMLLGMYRSYTK